MSRLHLRYDAPSVPVTVKAVAAEDHDAAPPVEGLYRHRLAKGGMFVAIRIWFGQPLDPVTGEEMDRSLRWQATANGKYIDLDRVWPWCGGDPIDEAEAKHLMALQKWGEDAGHEAVADPRKRLDPLSTPLQF